MISTSFYYIAQNYYIPSFSRVNAGNPAEAIGYYKTALVKSGFLSIITAAILILGSELVLNSFLGEISIKKFDLAENLFFIYTLTLPLSFVLSIIISWEYFNNRYLHSLISQIWPNLLIILFVLFASGSFGVYTIAYGYLSGIVLQFLHLIFITRKDLREKSIAAKMSFARVRLIPAFIVVVLIEIVGQFNPLVDRAFFTQIKEGSISALNYANNLMLLPVSMIAMAFSTALFPRVADYFAKQDFDALRNKLGQSIELITFLILPLVLLFLIFPYEIVNTVYINSSFSSDDLEMVSSSFFILILSLIFYSVYAVFSKFLYGINGAFALLIINISALLIKLAVNYFFIHEYNYLTLAISTSVSYVFLFGASLILIYKRIGGISNFQLVNIIKIVASLSITGGLGVLLAQWLPLSSLYLKLGFLILLLLVYFLFARLFKLRIVKLVFNKDLVNAAN
ncbi:MAG: hypothetical protein FMNOHCHN_02361 [Ignavibacteriaceae bacterium]|nr:hypothetical protein [Ignavibacteriaceae bacterium]